LPHTGRRVLFFRLRTRAPRHRRLCAQSRRRIDPGTIGRRARATRRV